MCWWPIRLVANAVVRSARRAYMIGVKVGQTSIFFFDAEGRQIAGFDIAVKRDLNGIRDAIRQALPSSDIRVEALGADGIVLSGTVATPAEAQTAFSIAGRLVNQGTAILAATGDKIVNAIVVRDRDQVNLRVTVAEVQRDVIKQIGVDLNGSVGVGSAVLRFQQRESVSGLRQRRWSRPTGSPARSRRMAARSTQRCGRWNAPV